MIMPRCAPSQFLTTFGMAAATVGAALMFAASCPAAGAEPRATVIVDDVAPFSRMERVAYTVRSQTLYDTDNTVEFQVNTWAAAEALAQQRESVNSRFEDIEIVEAATLEVVTHYSLSERG